jgi:Uncharacterized protein containing a von Willebrand factor type A (vWA) domain
MKINAIIAAPAIVAIATIASVLALSHIGCMEYTSYDRAGGTWSSSMELTHAPVMRAMAPSYDSLNDEEYNKPSENGFKYVKDAPLSTFSTDVDTASYSIVRRHLNQGKMPPKDAVRVEEMVNYFSYDYSEPKGEDPVAITVEEGECLWNAEHRLARVSLKARSLASGKIPPSNLVLLIDVSGSMYGPNRLGLVKASMTLLVNNLRDEDRVAIVVYAGSAGEVLPSTPGSDKQKIREALDALESGGSTAGGAGIALAYKIAEKNFVKGGNNRVVLCTDGDFNVGVSSNEELEKLVAAKRGSGIFLTVLGYGMGNHKDAKLQTLAEKGDGNHAYIDSLQEANRALVLEFGSTMYAVAKDVKLQVEFNPAHIQAYRLVGYESRLLKDEDFNNDAKDAGELGAGHAMTAFYEIVPAGMKFGGAGSVDPLKYQAVSSETKPEDAASSAPASSPEWLTVKLRYKEPEGGASKLLEQPFAPDGKGGATDDFRFASAVAAFGQLLSGSAFAGDIDCGKIESQARAAFGADENGYRREFVRLVSAAKPLMADAKE